jgi:hypothetical protein
MTAANHGVCANRISRIPVVGAVVLLLYLHRRNVKKLKKEDATDPHKGMDFGLGDTPGGKKRKSSFFGGEKNGSMKQRQLSMDLDMSTPYLLPPGLQGSRESLHSLARTLQQNEDPYRQITRHPESEATSMRSFKRGQEGSSVYTGSTNTRRNSGVTGRSVPAQIMPPPPRQNSLPKPPPPTADPFQQQLSPSTTGHSSQGSPPSPLPKDSFKSTPDPTIAQGSHLPYPEEIHATAQSGFAQISDVQQPAPVASRIPRKAPSGGLPTNPRPQWDDVPVPASRSIDAAHGDLNFQFQSQQNPPGLPPQPEAHQTSHEQDVYGLGLQNVPADSLQLPQLSPPTVTSLPSSPRRQRKQSLPAPVPEPAPAPAIQEPEFQADHHYYPEQDYQQYEYDQPGYAQQDYQPHGHQEEEYYDEYDQYNYPQQQYEEDYGYDRGRPAQRRSVDLQQDGMNQLGVPQYDNRRMSVGFRPLPPDEIIESEDPETRANRIRSFYKEYFDESRQHDPHAPPVPQQQHYYEDYDHHYAGETAFFDPESNAFVMPYAQPVTRRAMTPPPNASRFRGPPPPRGMHGSVGGMSLPGGRGPPRPGSSMSNRWGPPRPGSSVSGRYGYGQPRAGSSMSGRYGRPPVAKKRGPPPTALSTLPNPSKLKDDSFALMGAIDFAPPDSYKERQAGRSQSPAGERRPYAMKLPSHSPLVSSFDELASVPSPYAYSCPGTITKYS